MEMLLSKIRPAASALRKVDKDSPKFREIVESIGRYGVLNPISVQRREDEETGEEYYELCDGLHRYMAAQEAGLENIPVHEVEFDDVDTLVAQVHANYGKVETKASEFSKQMVRILQEVPTMTESELAEKCGFSLKFLRDRLKLNKIESEEIKGLIDDGHISLQNAYALATLPATEQEAFKDAAIAEPPQEFVPSVKAKRKELRDQRKRAKTEEEEFPGAKPRLRTLKELKALREDLTPLKQFVTNDMSVDDAICTALDYIMCLDPESVDAVQAKWEAKKKKREEAKARRKEKKKEQKAKKAQEKAAKAKEEADRMLAEARGDQPQNDEQPEQADNA